MRRAILLCCLSIGCGDPLTAKVGLLPDDEPDDAQVATPIPVASSALDAALTQVSDASLEASAPSACVQLPDLQVQYGDAAVSSTVRIKDITAECLPLGNSSAAHGYLVERLDGQPLLRAYHRYALSWPLPGQTPSDVTATGCVLRGAASACTEGELLGTLENAGRTAGCINLSPTTDGMLKLVPSFLLVFGTFELQLCEGSCP